MKNIDRTQSMVTKLETLICRLTGNGPPVVTTVNGITGAIAEAIPAAYVDGKRFSFRIP
jgi:hypothetical protein